MGKFRLSKMRFFIELSEGAAQNPDQNAPTNATCNAFTIECNLLCNLRCNLKKCIKDCNITLHLLTFIGAFDQLGIPPSPALRKSWEKQRWVVFQEMLTHLSSIRKTTPLPQRFFFLLSLSLSLSLSLIHYSLMYIDPMH